MGKIYAPFTDEQIEKLKSWQSGFKVDPRTEVLRYSENDKAFGAGVPVHPFTCCSHDGCERSSREDEGVLIPSAEGWICPCGKYTQNWCHDFMVE